MTSFMEFMICTYHDRTTTMLAAKGSLDYGHHKLNYSYNNEQTAECYNAILQKGIGYKHDCIQLGLFSLHQSLL